MLYKKLQNLIIGSYCSNRDNIILKQKYARETIIVLVLDLFTVLQHYTNGGGLSFFQYI
jgi:hypothetical protein